ncbi:MAG: DUF1330 domain-containing protein [Alphaproteobacteria bacterium]
MAAYMVFEVNVTDPSWREEYAPKTAELVAKHGGKYLSAAPAEKMEGERALPSVVVILEFPSVDAAKAWHADADYQPMIKLRNTGSSAEALLVPGV